MITSHTVAIMQISNLRFCPVRVNLHTEQMISTITESIAARRLVPGIVVARVGRFNYVVDGHARVEAYQRADMAEINVSEILKLGSEVDVVLEHVRRNTRSCINPLRLATAVAFLERSGIKDPPSRMALSPVMKAAVRVIRMWPEDLRSRVLHMFDSQAIKFSDVNVMPHFFVAFEDLTVKARSGDRIAEDELRNVVEYIIHYLGSIGDEGQFTLPGPDQVQSIIRGRRQRIAAMSVVMGKADEAQIAENGELEKKEIVMPDRNKTRIECTECGRPQVIDLKTGHVCKVEQVGGALEVIRDGSGNRAFMLGPESVKMLGLEDYDDDYAARGYRVFATDRRSEAEQIVRSFGPSARFVIIVSDGKDG